MLYVQKDIAENLLEMLFGAMDELKVGNPWLLSTDVGPVIDQAAKDKIEQHCREFAAKGRVLKTLATPDEGLFVAPTVIQLDGIEQLEQEIFGPVLHVATFEASELDQVVDAINDQGYGLTFGLHTRVDKRVARICDRIKVGNIYVNRNQIGAIVGSQPFGGEGLSGTGPKAGGPHYVKRFIKPEAVSVTSKLMPAVNAAQLQHAINTLDNSVWATADDRAAVLQQLFTDSGIDFASLQHGPQEMPGPTGELNLLSDHGRGVVLCLGPDRVTSMTQATIALSQGNAVVVIAPEAEQFMAAAITRDLPVAAISGLLMPQALETASGFAAIASNAGSETLRQYRIAMARRDGALLPLITEQNSAERYVIERHLCIDTTAAGGNASLIAASE
jgi:RHH-type proline utilization regulon transcriptional repressor/proline dehydrogenase/delta 1-pyrroline-5-carboxylate dehydrogenase